mgnify:FL=1
MKKTSQVILSHSFAALLVCMPVLVSAQATLDNPLRVDSLVGLLLAIVDILLILAVPVIIFFIIYAGFLYVTAQGNPSKISDANRALLYALIGGVIVLGARVIGALIQNTVNSVTVP